MKNIMFSMLLVLLLKEGIVYSGDTLLINALKEWSKDAANQDIRSKRESFKILAAEYKMETVVVGEYCTMKSGSFSFSTNTDDEKENLFLHFQMNNVIRVDRDDFVLYCLIDGMRRTMVYKNLKDLSAKTENDQYTYEDAEGWVKVKNPRQKYEKLENRFFSVDKNNWSFFKN